jgi:hypothetical protein
MKRQLAISASACRSIFALFCALFFLSFSAEAQVDTPPPIKIRVSDDKDDGDANTIQEMLAKQQITRRKKEYDEMVKQGEDALKLSEELENAFESKDDLSNQEIQKLQELEKIVSKIREELGGSDDDDKEDISSDNEENEARKSTPAAFKFLRETTIKLVDEIKKSTRFSISVAAIRASNSVIKFARFLRLKK